MAVFEHDRPTVTSPAPVTRETPARRARVVERRWWGPTLFGPGTLLGVLGAAAVVVSLFLSWRDPGIHPDRIPAAFLWDRGALSDPSLLIFLIPIAVVLLLGALVPLGGPLRLLAGLAMLIVVGAFAYQLDRTLNGTRVDLGDVLGTGFYVGAIGGVLGLIGGLMPAPWVSRREVRSVEPVDTL